MWSSGLRKNHYTVTKIMICCHELRQSDTRQVPAKSSHFREGLPETVLPVCFLSFPSLKPILLHKSRSGKVEERLAPAEKQMDSSMESVGCCRAT